MLLGFALRFVYIGVPSLWLDEAISLEVARLDWHNFFRVISKREINMSVYYFLLHFWIFFGQSEFALRSLSALFGAITIPAIYALGTTLFCEATGIVAALLIAVNPAHISYSQSARGYALTIFLTVISSWLFVRAIENDSPAIWTAYSLVNMCGLYSHVFFAWVVLVQLLSIVCVRDFSWRLARWSYAALVLSMVPLAYVEYLSQGTHLSWLQRPSLVDLFNSFINLGGRSGMLLTGFLLFFAVLALSARKQARDERFPTAIEFLTLWWILPIVLTFAISFRYPLFVPRYLSISLPPLLLLSGRGIVRSRKKFLNFATVSAVLLVSAPAIGNYYDDAKRNDQNNNWRDTALYMRGVLREGDALLFYYGAERFPFDFYRPPHQADQKFAIYPPLSSAQLLLGDGKEPDDELLHVLASRYRRVYVLSEYPNSLYHRVIEGLSMSRCVRQAEARNFGFVRVDEFDYC